MLLGALPSSGAAQVGLDVFEVHLRPDSAERVMSIGIRSLSDSVQQVRLSLGNWQRDSSGGNVFAPYAESVGHCGDRLEIFPQTLVLGSRATDAFRVTYRRAGPVDVGCWAIVFADVVQSSSAAVSGGMGATVTVRQGVKVYVHPAQSMMSAAVEFADVESLWVPRDTSAGNDSSLARQVAIRVVNTGNDHLILRSALEIRDASSRLLHRVEGPEAYITPDAFRDVLIRLPDLVSGAYYVLALLDYGGDEVLAAQLEVEIP